MQGIGDIKRTISQDIVKKIFGNKLNAIAFLEQYKYDDKELQKQTSAELYAEIVRIWNYNEAKDKIRTIFKNTSKFNNGLNAEENITILLNEWRNLNLGAVDWPFSQGQFDNFVQQLNGEGCTRIEKDEKVKMAAVKYRRIKELNTERNDFLETLVFLKNENIIPTLSHSKGIDFFIDGVSYDQKVSRSPTNEFKRDFGANWRDYAIQHPNKVAEYLYKYQDEGRFGASPRLLIVYLDEEISPLKIQQIIKDTNLTTPLEVIFDFQHKDMGVRTYRTEAFVILLHN